MWQWFFRIAYGVDVAVLIYQIWRISEKPGPPDPRRKRIGFVCLALMFPLVIGMLVTSW